MVSRSEDSINFDKLEKELEAAVEFENRYWKENDAKFRAVNQKVGTYEEFRDIVAAAHLKPLEKTDTIGKSFKQIWNSTADKAEDQTSGNIAKSKSCDVNGSSSVECLPKNTQEFFRMWKNTYCSTISRYNFLLCLGGDQVERIFRNEVSFGLLGELICVLETQYQDKDYDGICAILRGLSGVNRFQLTMDFLSSVEQAACHQLFQKLHQTSIDFDLAPADARLKQAYRIQ